MRAPLSRRLVLTAPAALALPAAPALAALHPDSELAAIRSRVREYWAAVSAEVALENCPGHQEACERADALHGELSALADDLLSRPVTSWLDVAKRAEIAGLYYEPQSGELADSPCPSQRALGGLLDAVLTMGARHG
jgi:hypothetical protein